MPASRLVLHPALLVRRKPDLHARHRLGGAVPAGAHEAAARVPADELWPGTAGLGTHLALRHAHHILNTSCQLLHHPSPGNLPKNTVTATKRPDHRKRENHDRSDKPRPRPDSEIAPSNRHHHGLAAQPTPAARGRPDRTRPLQDRGASGTGGNSGTSSMAATNATDARTASPICQYMTSPATTGLRNPRININTSRSHEHRHAPASGDNNKNPQEGNRAANRKAGTNPDQPLACRGITTDALNSRDPRVAPNPTAPCPTTRSEHRHAAHPKRGTEPPSR